jgi:NAD+ synthase (glutamine-hydrolysing)
MSFRVSLAQINPTVGDLDGNAAKVLAHAARAAVLQPDVVVFPELALTGYPPEDLVLRGHFVRDAAAALARVAKDLPRGLSALVGFVEKGRLGLHNAAAFLRGGKVQGVYRKRLLPNYGVFDEKRYFTPGGKPMLLKLGGVTAAVTICEDIWTTRGPAQEAARLGAKVVLNLSASPYHAGKLTQRRRIVQDTARACKAPVAYCNMVGGQDELVFDGGSIAVDARGRALANAPQFEETVVTVDLPAPGKAAPGRPPLTPALSEPLPELEEIYAALMLGTRDYLRKNGFAKAVLGLSGGIDSSLVACLAVDALGKENVVGVTLPSRYNSPETRSDAQILAHHLGIDFKTIPIQTAVDELLDALKPAFDGRPADLTEENLQSRVRGTLLMALSNKFGWLVLTTGNKSEVSVGYSTLYGDTAGGFAPIKDIPKGLVYRLCEWRNMRARTDLIPATVFTRAPTAELRPDQTDQDSLPPYDVLDKAVTLYVEEDKGLDELVKAGIDPATAARVVKLVDGAEYKRRQAPPGVKITPKAFGRDRRMPITNKYRVTGRE